MTKLKVVPEPSERCTTVILPSGSLTPGFSAAIAGSFQVLILPRKMLPRVGPSSFSAPGAMPATLITGTTPPITDGNWARPAAASSSGFSGASEEPKSTVAALIWAIPPPEPMDW